MVSIIRSQIASPQSSLSISAIEHPAYGVSLSKGDELRALVVQRLNGHEVLLEAKGSTFPAESDLSLKVGDTLHLKVAETNPQIILSMIPSPEGDSPLVRTNLAMFRSNPDGMLNLVKNGLEIFQGNLEPLLSFVDKGEMDAIHWIIHSLIYSEKTLDDPQFINKYLINIGYLVERSLRKSSDNSMEEDRSSSAAKKSLKGLLGRLSSRIHLLMSETAGSDSDPRILKALKNLSDYADSSLETIYNQQVVNIVGQEENQGYYLQIPIQSADDLRMVDLFINLKERNSKGKKGTDTFQFVLFLNMDALGDLVIDVQYQQKKIWGTFKCGTVESRNFLLDFMDVLKDRIHLSGYGPANFNVYYSSNLMEEKADYMNEKVIYSKKIINCFA